MAEISSSVLAAAAVEAPRAPGVYFFLDDQDDLLYVGKAGDIRTRLRQQALVTPVEGYTNRRYQLVRSVRWETHPDEDAATTREADLIVALRPPHNAFIDNGKWVYLSSAQRHDTWLRDGPLRAVPLVRSEPQRDGAYGCFPLPRARSQPSTRNLMRRRVHRTAATAQERSVPFASVISDPETFRDL